MGRAKSLLGAALGRGKRAIRGRIDDIRGGDQLHRVEVIGAGSVEVKRGQPLLRAMLAEGMQVNHFCGGNGSCGTCRVTIVEGMENLGRLTTAEQVAGGGREPGLRLACQARVRGDIKLKVKM